MINTMNIKGSLKPVIPSNVEGQVEQAVRQVTGDNGMWWVLSENPDTYGVLEINARKPCEKDNFPAEVTSYGKAWHYMWGVIEAIQTLIETEGIAKDNIEGAFTVTVETDEDPLIVKIAVKGEEVTYQEAKITWDTEISY